MFSATVVPRSLVLAGARARVRWPVEGFLRSNAMLVRLLADSTTSTAFWTAVERKNWRQQLVCPSPMTAKAGALVHAMMGRPVPLTLPCSLVDRYVGGCYKLLNSSGPSGCTAPPGRGRVTALLARLEDLPRVLNGGRGFQAAPSPGGV
jgi:hypothetical protein